MEFINITSENIGQEHICCAFSDKKSIKGYELKKQWLTEQFKHNYQFVRLDERAKVFIEYVDAEYAWAPLDAPNYKVINCFWVSGKYKSHGWGKKLLDNCVQNAQNKDGIVILSSKKKRPFMADAKFLKRQGFIKCDEAPPYFELYYYPINKDAKPPQFKDTCTANINNEEGLVAYYTDACPFTDYYVTTVLKECAQKRKFPFKAVKIETKEQAQKHAVPFTIFSLFADGEFITHEILSENKFNKLFP